MKEIVILEKIWLLKNESTVYITLLRSWPLNIKQLALKSKQSRPSIYKTIPHLQELWLVSEVIKGKRKIYQAESPEHLKNIFQRTQSDFEKVFTSLKSLHETAKSRPILTSIEGENFGKFIFEDVAYSLDTWDTYLRYSARNTNQWIEKYDTYRKIRDEKEIQRLIITSEESIKNKPSRLDHEVCSIPENFDLFDDNISKVIYKDKVAIIDYNTQTSFVIEDEKFARFEAKIFRLLFKFLKKNS